MPLTVNTPMPKADAAASITLTADEQQQLEAATANLPVIGERYTPEGMKGG